MRSICMILFVAVLGCSQSGGERQSSAGGLSGIQHPFFPLERGFENVYEGESNGVHRLEEELVLVDVREILGVACTGVRERVYLDGQLTEISIEWYSLDSIGNVWKYGEEAWVIDGGRVVAEPDSWMAGQDGFEPWILFPAVVAPGDRIVVPKRGGFDEYIVTSDSAAVLTPAGEFHECLEILENPTDPADSDIVLYGRGVGRVSEKSRDTKIVLIKRRLK